MVRWVNSRFLACFGLALGVSHLTAQPESPIPSVLTRIDQILKFTQEEAQRQHPVQLEGVVTFSDPDWGLLFVQDPTAGICLEKLPAPLVVNPGDLLSIEGVTSAGQFSPVVISRTAKSIRKVPLPAPQSIRVFDLNSGGAHGQWVELRGVVHFEEEVGERLRLDLASGLNRCRVWVLHHSRHRNLKLTDSQVRVRGVAGAEFDGHHRFNGFQLYVSSLSDVTVVEPPVLEAFARPITLGRDLIAPLPLRNAEHRLHVRGVVLMQWRGRLVFLRDATRGIYLRTSSAPQLRSGELVEAVGFRVLGELTPQLESAVVRSVGMGPPPEPLVLTATEKLADQANFNLVQFDARLVHVNAAPPDQVCLSLHDGFQGWTAFLQSPNPASLLSQFTSGSRVRVTGVCQFVDSEQRGARRLELWLRSLSDVQVLDVPLSAHQLAVFWTGGTLGLGGVCGGAVLIWLRRRNRRRLRQTLDVSRRHLHRHLEERKRIGQDLHDNIMPSIYAVGLGLEDCRRLVQKSPDQAVAQIAIATRALNSVLQDVRQFIGGLEPQTFNGVELSTALQSLAQTAGQYSSHFIIQTDPNASSCLTPYQATQLLKVAKEAMSNSLRHAQASQTRVALGLDRDRVRLEISDDGIGFDPKAVSPRGHGLRNVAARARELGAQCEIISACGKGTRVVVDLPVSTLHDTHSPA